MKNFLFGGVRLNSPVADFGLFVLRAFAGTSLALAHGLGKLPPSAQFMSGVQALGLPPQAAWLSGFAEFFCGLLIAVGLGTRPAALVVAMNMSVAVLRQHANDPYLRAELAYLYLAVAVMFVLVGAGRFSIDRVIKK